MRWGVVVGWGCGGVGGKVEADLEGCVVVGARGLGTVHVRVAAAGGAQPDRRHRHPTAEHHRGACRRADTGEGGGGPEPGGEGKAPQLVATDDHAQRMGERKKQKQKQEERKY